MSTTASTTPNIGPGVIAQASVTNGPSFSLSATEWISIQTYVADALALPTTMQEFIATLGPGAPSDTSDFTKIVNAYATINEHCKTWQNTIFPATVSLAADVYHYSQQAPTYFNPILPLAQTLTQNPDDQTAKDELKAILGVLIKSASDKHDNAAAVAAQIQTFATDTQADKVTLSGTDGEGGLQKYYNDKYGATSADVQALLQDIKAQGLIVKAKSAEYKHDVIVASTTPTYAWIWPFGTIAAGVVAGIYGKRAVDALDALHAAQDKIKTFEAEKQADTNLMAFINATESGITDILDPLNAALPIIEKIQGVWGAIASDLGNINTLIDSDIAKVPPIIMNLGVTSAIEAWTAVGEEANAYRVNAYIKVNK